MDDSVLISFCAYGVMGIRDYKIDFNNDATIIVGPNGTGKSTFLSIFYLFVTQQWGRLAEHQFSYLELLHTKGTIKLNRETLETFQGTVSGSHTARRFFDRLRKEGMVDLLKKETLSKEERSRVARVVGVPSEQASSVLRYIQGELAVPSRMIT